MPPMWYNICMHAIYVVQYHADSGSAVWISVMNRMQRCIVWSNDAHHCNVATWYNTMRHGRRQSMRVHFGFKILATNRTE